MSINGLYGCPVGRAAVVLLQKTGMFHLASWFLKTSLSKKLIPGYIAKHQIDMQDFAGQEYASFAEFFSRKREGTSYVIDPKVLISPCDGLLSIYSISDRMRIAMKSSHYRLSDLVPDAALAEQLSGGLCMVFRLQASDYHHFCAFDDAVVSRCRFLPGTLHSVQPIACENVAVYRLNRRWWSVLDTVHFGTAVQVEVGAMLVGGVRFAKESGWISRGEDMGCFELAGSTVLLLLPPETGRHLGLFSKFRAAFSGAKEVPVRMGEGIGVWKDETETIEAADPAALCSTL